MVAGECYDTVCTLPVPLVLPVAGHEDGVVLARRSILQPLRLIGDSSGPG